MLRRAGLRAWLVAPAALLCGCVNLYSDLAKIFPVTEAFRTHVATKTVDESLVYVVWVDHEWVKEAVVKWLKERGHTVVEGVVLEKILEENKFRITNTPDDEKRIMVAAKMAGAQQVLFGTSTISTEFEARRVITELGGLGQKPTYYYVTVTLRSFDLDTGNLAWRATGRYTGPTGYPVASLVTLAVWTMARGMCPTEAGFTWTDPKDVDDRAGCFRKEG